MLKKIKVLCKLVCLKIRILLTVTLADTIDITEIIDEISYALENMKCGKEPREDGIVTDLLKDTREKFHKELVHLFTSA